MSFYERQKPEVRALLDTLRRELPLDEIAADIQTVLRGVDRAVSLVRRTRLVLEQNRGGSGKRANGH